MRLCKLAVRVAFRHSLYFSIYVVLLTALALFSAGGLDGGSESEGTTFEDDTPTVAVIDRDGSALSRAIADAARAHSEVVDVADTPRALQDAAAKDLATYTLVIPAGFGDGLLEAAHTGGNTPELQTLISYKSGRGSIANERVRGYVQSLYGFAANAPDASAAQLIAWADAAQDTHTPVEVVSGNTGHLSQGYGTYAVLSCYPAFTGTCALVAVGLKSLSDARVKQRLLTAPLQSDAFGMQMTMACGAIGLVVWAFIAGAGLVFYDVFSPEIPLAAVAIAVLGQLAFTAVGAATGFLLWQIGGRQMATNAAANVTGLVLMFLSGALMPVATMTPEVLTLARCTPFYWTAQAIDQLVGAVALTGEVAASTLESIGVTLAFAVAIAVVGLAVGCAKTRDAAA